MSDSEGPPEKGKLAGESDLPNRPKTEAILPDHVNRLEAIADILTYAEDALAQLALGDPDQFGQLLRPAVRLRTARREISEFLRKGPA